MPHDRFSLNARTVLVIAIAAAYPVAGHAAPAARVDFAIGNVTATGTNGQSRALARGAEVDQGETVNTNGGRAQLHFTDGAFVSLQPESQFRIDQYRYDGKQDGNEKGFFSLLKGGLRTITGLVGRTNKANYQVTTSVATIGIRGTEYTIQYGQSITGSVGEGEINVCNNAGCQSVVNGESYYVQTQDARPVITNKRTDLPPAPPSSAPTHFTAGETTDKAGNLSALTSTISGTLPLNVGTAANSNGTFLSTTATVAGGALQTFDASGNPITFTAPFFDVGGDSFILWGRAASSGGGETSAMTPYVAGIPTDLTGLSGTATYTLFGGTSITDSSGNKVGSLNTATMSVNFLSGSASGTMAMAMTLAGQPRNLSVNVSPAQCGPTPSFSLFGCAANLNLSGQGFFAGAGAVRAGFVYDVSESQLGVNGRGAAALKKN